jgi:hypothetical protein
MPKRRHGDSHASWAANPHRMWRQMRVRCQRAPTHEKYRYWGGRGCYCDSEWESYENFRDWAYAHGWQPGASLDRIDPYGPYAPWNCQIVSKQVNGYRTTKRTVWTVWDETKPFYEWAKDSRCLVNGHTFRERVKRGWTVEVAMSTPAQSRSTS